MKSEKILFNEKEYYINSESLNNPDIKNIFLFKDPELTEVVTNSSGMTRIIKKENIEEILKENIGGAGGAGYAVWGGGWGRSFGNPSMGGRFYGRGFGFGQGSSHSGGPNIMYTYDVKPLNQTLQQPGTSQGDDRYIHVGCEIQGKILNKNKKIKGKIIGIKKDEDHNIQYYIVLDIKTGEKVNIDPTSIELITHAERPDPYIKDLIVGENFYPSFSEFLNETKKEKKDNPWENVKRKVERSKKIPKEMKEKIISLIKKDGIYGSKYNKKGMVTNLKIPKIKGKSFNGVGLGADKDGFFVHTHRARSKSKPEIEKIPNKDIKFIESTG